MEESGLKRDFSDTAKEDLKQVILQNNEKDARRFLGSMIDFGADLLHYSDLDIEEYYNDITTYHQKIIDKEDVTVSNLEQIFNNVTMVDETYKWNFDTVLLQLQSYNQSVEALGQVMSCNASNDFTYPLSLSSDEFKALYGDVSETLEYSLSDSDINSFVCVGEVTHDIGDGEYYGGNQSWWGADSAGRNYGCGVIAATNTIIYLAQHLPELRDLYDGDIENITQEEYMALADSLWKYIKPNTSWDFSIATDDPYSEAPAGGIGVWTTNKIENGILAYAQDKDVNITSQLMTNAPTYYGEDNHYSQAVDFIKENLSNDCPVQLLTWNNEEFAFHWVTITKLEENVNTGNISLTVSTWDDLKVIDNFEEYWEFDELLGNKFLTAFTPE